MIRPNDQPSRQNKEELHLYVQLILRSPRKKHQVFLWLKIRILVTTNTAGDGQLALQITTGVTFTNGAVQTQTALTCLTLRRDQNMNPGLWRESPVFVKQPPTQTCRALFTLHQRVTPEGRLQLQPQIVVSENVLQQHTTCMM